MNFRAALLSLLTSAWISPISLAQDGDSPAPESAPATEESVPTEAVSDQATPIVEPVIDSPQDEHEVKGLFGSFRIGPTVTVGFPHPMNYGLDLQLSKNLSFNFSTGKFERDFSDKVNVQIANWDLRARWHPFSGSFFIGAAYGQQELSLRAEEAIKLKVQGFETAVPTTIQVDLKTNYLSPHLGWFAVWDSGFTLGFEIGAQVPMSNKTTMDVGFKEVSSSQESSIKGSDEYQKLKTSVDDAGDLMGKKVIPYITLVRLGWLL